MMKKKVIFHDGKRREMEIALSNPSRGINVPFLSNRVRPIEEMLETALSDLTRGGRHLSDITLRLYLPSGRFDGDAEVYEAADNV